MGGVERLDIGYNRLEASAAIANLTLPHATALPVQTLLLPYSIYVALWKAWIGWTGILFLCLKYGITA